MISNPDVIRRVGVQDSFINIIIVREERMGFIAQAIEIEIGI